MHSLPYHSKVSQPASGWPSDQVYSPSSSYPSSHSLHLGLDLVLDISNFLHPPSLSLSQSTLESQELYLFTFVSELLRQVVCLPYQQLFVSSASTQSSPLSPSESAKVLRHFLNQLMQILLLPTPVSSLSRLIRHNLGAAFVLVFQKLGDDNRSLLFDTLTSLIAIVGGGGPGVIPTQKLDHNTPVYPTSSNSKPSLAARHAAIYCLGSIFFALGNYSSQLASAASNTLLKFLKSIPALTAALNQSVISTTIPTTSNPVNVPPGESSSYTTANHVNITYSQSGLRATTFQALARLLFGVCGSSTIDPDAIVNQNVNLIHTLLNPVPGSLLSYADPELVGSGTCPLEESLVKEIWKAVRTALKKSKSALVTLMACECLTSMIVKLPNFLEIVDRDRIISVILKIFENPSKVVRQSAALCLATYLIQCFDFESVSNSLPTEMLPSPTVTVSTSSTGSPGGPALSSKNTGTSQTTSTSSSMTTTIAGETILEFPSFRKNRFSLRRQATTLSISTGTSNVEKFQSPSANSAFLKRQSSPSDGEVDAPKTSHTVKTGQSLGSGVNTPSGNLSGITALNSGSVKKSTNINHTSQGGGGSGLGVVNLGSVNTRQRANGAKVGRKLSLEDVLRELSSQYCKTNISHRFRATLAVTYVFIFESLPNRIIGREYSTIVIHLLRDLLARSSSTRNRYRLLTTRRFVRIILEGVIHRHMLDERMKIEAAKVLINLLSTVGQWKSGGTGNAGGLVFSLGSGVLASTSGKSRNDSGNDEIIVGGLAALGSLIKDLGNECVNIVKWWHEGLLGFLEHSSYVVQIHAAGCLQAFSLSYPQEVKSMGTECLRNLSRELESLSASKNGHRKCLGLAYGLSGAVSTVGQESIYGCAELWEEMFSMARRLLKLSVESDLRIASTQIQVAWILLNGLLTVGNDFVKIHMNQLLLLWKNALGEALKKEDMNERDTVEITYLAHVRSCALGNILVFLVYNKRLLTEDVVKRIGKMLAYTMTFLERISVRKRMGEDSSDTYGGSTSNELQLPQGLSLTDYETGLRKRIFQSYSWLLDNCPLNCREKLLEGNFLPQVVRTFADPEKFGASNSSVMNFSTRGDFIWEIGDNCAFGMTSLLRGYMIRGEASGMSNVWYYEDVAEHEMSDWTRGLFETVEHPTCGALEHDAIWLNIGKSESLRRRRYGVEVKSDDIEMDWSFEDYPEPPGTQVVDAAVELFSISLPLNGATVQESILEQVSNFLMSHTLQRDMGRKAAIIVNVAVGLDGALYRIERGIKESAADPRMTTDGALVEGNLSHPSVVEIIKDLLHGLLEWSDGRVRSVASDGLGRLCCQVKSDEYNREVTWLTEQIIHNREANSRAGYALGLSRIFGAYSVMGKGSNQVKNIVGLLTSLARDPNATVHYWALESLARVIDVSGVAFSNWLNSTLVLLVQLYSLESHGCEGSGSLNEGGDDLKLNEGSGEGNYHRYWELDYPTTGVIGRCISSLIHVLGPDICHEGPMRQLVLAMTRQLLLERGNVKESLGCGQLVSIYGGETGGWYTGLIRECLTSKNGSVRRLAQEGLEMLIQRRGGSVMDNEGLQVQFWRGLNHESENPVLQRIIEEWLNATRREQRNIWVERCARLLFQRVELNEEWICWESRALLLHIVSELIDDEAARDTVSPNLPLETIIRMGFGAATSGICLLRIRGLAIINRVLQVYGHVEDDQEEVNDGVSVLEQYEAQISSAIAPAFAGESTCMITAELVNEAIKVCATFVTSGIVRETARMGRIVRWLVSMLDYFTVNNKECNLSDYLENLPSNAQTMIKLAVFAAWARVCVAAAQANGAYLRNLLQQRCIRLHDEWLSGIQTYAKLRFEPVSCQTVGLNEESTQAIYTTVNKSTALTLYESVWLTTMEAVLTVQAMSHQDESEDLVGQFFIFFGLLFHALSDPDGSHRPDKYPSITTPSYHLPRRVTVQKCLRVLQTLLQRPYAVNLIYQNAVFTETVELLQSILLTQDDLAVKTSLVDIARDLCVNHPVTKTIHHHDSSQSDNTGESSPPLHSDFDQLFQLTKLIVTLIAQLLPAATEITLDLLLHAVNALVDISRLFPVIIQCDLNACLLHLIDDLLASDSCQSSPFFQQILPLVKRFLRANNPRSTVLHSSLAKFLRQLQRSRLRESPHSIARERNCLLLITLILCISSHRFTPHDPLLLEFLALLHEGLDNALTCKVAASCCRSILLLPGSDPVQRFLLREILPRLVYFISHFPLLKVYTSPELIRARIREFHRQLPSDDQAAFHNAIEILKSSLLTFIIRSCDSPTSDHYTSKIHAAISLLLPTLLSRATYDWYAYSDESEFSVSVAKSFNSSFSSSSDSEFNLPVYQALRSTASLLLDLARLDPALFRTHAAMLNPSLQQFMRSLFAIMPGPVPKASEHNLDKESLGPPAITVNMIVPLP